MWTLQQETPRLCSETFYIILVTMVVTWVLAHLLDDNAASLLFSKQDIVNTLIIFIIFMYNCNGSTWDIMSSILLSWQYDNSVLLVFLFKVFNEQKIPNSSFFIMGWCYWVANFIVVFIMLSRMLLSCEKTSYDMKIIQFLPPTEATFVFLRYVLV